MTIKDLSAQTGYSVGTVSRVLNHQPNVSEKAKKTILEAAAACGFQLNTNAQQLKQQRSNNILVLVKGASNQLFSALVESIQARVRNSTTYHLVVDYLDEDSNEVLRALQLIREKKPLGILFLGGNQAHFLKDFDRVDTPCVLVTSNGSDIPYRNLSSVGCDEDAAVKHTIEKLIEMGHRNFAIIGGNLERSDTARRRFRGCLAAFQEHGIPFDPDLDYATARFSHEAGYQAAQTLLRRSIRYTAIFCMADVMAMGAIRALSDRGFHVPEDVSVVGFDGLPIGEFIVPRLATVSQSVDLLAQRSVELLRQRIEGSHDAVHEVIPAQLQLRESARAL
jgi:LacI family transcriptional regulator